MSLWPEPPFHIVLARARIAVENVAIHLELSSSDKVLRMLDDTACPTPDIDISVAVKIRVAIRGLHGDYPI